MKCTLHSLDNPLLNGISLGLKLPKEGKVALDASFFPCCAGSGQAFDPRKNSIHFCELKKRLSRLQTLLEFYEECYPVSTRSPFQLSPADSNKVLLNLASVFKHDTLPASVTIVERKGPPSHLWTKAFAAIWRFGVDVRFSRINGFDLRELERVTRTSDEPIAIFIDQIENLNDPYHRESLDYIIQRAYNAQAFLWLEFFDDKSQKMSSDDIPDLKQFFRQKTSSIREKTHPLDELGADAISRLKSMSGVQYISRKNHNA